MIIGKQTKGDYHKSLINTVLHKCKLVDILQNMFILHMYMIVKDFKIMETGYFC